MKYAYNRMGFRGKNMGNNKEVNLFRVAAGLYDLDQRNITKDDISFYLEYASKLPGSILELACGTGRVTIPLANEGYNICGIDLSKEMLDQLKVKMENLQEEVKQRIHITQADMTNFELGRVFSLIIIPFRSFQLLISEEQQKACLHTVHRHLSEEGYFIINVFKPYAQLDKSWIQPEILDWETVDPVTGNKVQRTHIRREIDLENQIIYPELIYYVTDQDGIEEKIVEPLALKYYYEEQIRNLLQSNGFKIVEEMGYYDRRQISEGPELIFICKKE